VAVAAALLATLALGGAPAEPTGHRLAVSLAAAGPRTAGSAAERRAHARVRSVFRSAGLRVGADAFAVPGRGPSRNVVGAFDTPASCLYVVMAHTDTVAGTPGAEDNASGVGVLAALASRLRSRCDVWLVATGAEERIFTGSPDHLGALALVRRVRRLGRARDLRLALSLDEVGRGRRLVLKSSAASPRAGVERAVLDAARGTGLRVSWDRDAGAAGGNSDHREFQMAGLPAAKLGVASAPCRHTACDTPSRLDASTFPRVRRLVERLLREPPTRRQVWS
jgi:hypothetical protein